MSLRSRQRYVSSLANALAKSRQSQPDGSLWNILAYLVNSSQIDRSLCLRISLLISPDGSRYLRKPPTRAICDHLPDTTYIKPAVAPRKPSK
ncbi:uncharacterized protein UV8b_07244 [Ustilaginoidea virens]|uniref:Uncharacterized protein n=1 Tax=Ustilaginoidea virens TaxID=1159556 RepID=A0A8E5HX89_USTVR|nr:uncharacterized protein UV8b_07244 [Ustilaginoidea virens]QUC23003.1 hypothetical protein UV8b_07244 [Ustilaginoidea virens]